MSRFFSGKVLLCILMVAATTGGFTLGYFVGRSISSPPALSAVKQPLHEGDPVPPASVPRPGEAGDSPTPVSAVQGSAEIKQPENTPPAQKYAAEKKAAPTGIQKPSGAGATLSSGEKALPGQAALSQAAKPGSQSPSGTQPSEGSRDVAGAAVASPDRVLYTVQAGAFRSQKDAAALKNKLETKGHKAWIRKETGAKGAVFFKVRTGEFESRKEASLLALKLNKTDGLNAFATEKK